MGETSQNDIRRVYKGSDRKKENAKRLTEPTIFSSYIITGYLKEMTRFLTFLAFCILSTSITVQGAIDCPCGWIPIGSNCFFFSTFKTTWSKARDDCLNRGGDLVVPTDRFEEIAIGNIARKRQFTNLHEGPWIGLVRQHDKQFVTVYGLKPTYTDFLLGEPNNSNGNENCFHLKLSSPTTGWNDIRCGENFYYICEQKRSRCRG